MKALFKHIPSGNLLVRAMTDPFPRLLFRRIDEARYFMMVAHFIIRIRITRVTTIIRAIRVIRVVRLIRVIRTLELIGF